MKLLGPGLLGLAQLAAVLVTVHAAAADPKMIGAFEAWSAHLFADGNKRTCYVHAVPKSTEGEYKQRGQTYVQVTHRTADNVHNEVSVIAGYPYKKDSEVNVDIDGRSFALFTRNDGAWARDAKEDGEIVTAMKAGNTMIVRGVSSRGTQTTDTYSLLGFTAAHGAIDKACKSG